MSEFGEGRPFVPVIPAAVPLLGYRIPLAGSIRIYKGSVDDRDLDKSIPMSAPTDLLKEISGRPAPASPFSPAPEAPKEAVSPKTFPVISCKDCADLKRENRLLSKALALMSIKLMKDGGADE